MNRHPIAIVLLAVISLQSNAFGLPPIDPDPNGVLRKPIPDKLVVLTFDDSPESHATIVAPILKSLGFGGSFYVCDFDSFKTRKDWYMTFRQMKALSDEGFEIGNHTKGHYGSLQAFLDMEDELAAHDVPKPSTVCWPLYAVGWSICPELAKNGYVFGRGGHERPYRPTVDNPFDIPSYTIRDGVPVETFVKHARQACRGRIVVFTFHGVPDMEHAAVSLEPSTFRLMMKYLKDNQYQAIALRNLAKYIDPAKAVKLAPTANALQESASAALAREDKPYVAAAKQTPKSASAGQVPANISKAIKTPVGRANDISQIYAVTEVKNSQPKAFTWSKAEGGNWSDGSRWSNNLGDGAAPRTTGQADYALHFKIPGNPTVTNDLTAGFLLNRLDLTPVQSQGVTLAGNAIRLATNQVTGALPSIHEHTVFGRDKIDAPLILASDVEVNLIPAGQLSIAGLISGTGRLIYTGGNGNASGDLNGGPNQHYSNLSINYSANTYSGGTVINGGTLRLTTNHGLGTGPVTLNEGGGFVPASGNAVNPLILNGGVIDAGGVDWNAPITLNGNVRIAGRNVNLNKASGGISGPGGFTQIGTWGAFARVNGGEIYLWGANTYSGPTIVHQGTLFVKKSASLYNGDSASWTAAKIGVHPAATLVISAGGPSEFTGTQVGTLLGNLAASVDNNGLMAGAVFAVDAANAKEPVTVSTIIADSKGPGGGAFIFKKLGGGTLCLSGENTYTGRTILDGGTLSVGSINRFAGGQANSGLGAPTTLENGIIDFGGDCTLTYTGRGEVTDRIIDLADEQQTVTFNQSGSGLLKFTSPFDISGYGFNKTVVVTGSTAGTGELAGNIKNPYDRKGVAKTSLTKTGTGTWTLSGSNSYTGPTIVAQGTLLLASAKSLGPKTMVIIQTGAKLELSFAGRMNVHNLSVGGKVQPPGAYGAAEFPDSIRGTGVLNVQP
ncbi:MAG: autotransporter-associated beta strand repeat-containing protein [Planctomycetes bacterium]|nr:autotransporter-associated beta strand repeat-containing protein [Planctomycetota bacterium]